MMSCGRSAPASSLRPADVHRRRSCESGGSVSTTKLAGALVTWQHSLAALGVGRAEHLMGLADTRCRPDKNLALAGATLRLSPRLGEQRFLGKGVAQLRSAVVPLAISA